MTTHIKISSIVILALALWRESRGEKLETKRGVAGCIMNRVAHPGWWGKDVLSVLAQPWQISSFTDPSDRQLVKWPRSNDPSWIECVQVAEEFIEGKIKPPFNGADSYYDVSIPAPYWATDKAFVGQSGRIKFYNLDGDPDR